MLKQLPFPLTVGAGVLLSIMILFAVPIREWGALLIYLIAIFGLMTLLYRRGFKRFDPTISASLLLLALLAKLIGSTFRYWTVVDLYGGAADAVLYHIEGQYLAHLIQNFDFSFFGTYNIRGEGTTYLAYLNGLLYAIMPDSMAGSFFFFATLSLIGGFLFYWAMRLVWPQQSLDFYFLLLFFSPSILFWPSSIGKDAWIFFCSGLTAWGWAKFLSKSQITGLLISAIGLFGINLIRPHIAALLALSMGTAYMYCEVRNRRSLGTSIVGGIAILGLAVLALQSAGDFLSLDEFTAESIQEIYFEQQQVSFQGGSRYTPVSIFSPSGAAYGIITVLFRPFPWEAHNPQILLSAFESIVWLLVFWHKRQTFLTRLFSLHRDTWTATAVIYSFLMIMSLTAMSNFGILARQRVMFLPFLWMLFL